MITSPGGHKMNVCDYFQKPANSYKYLMEKTNIYLELYYNHSQPIIKEITHLKTIEFIENIQKHATKSHSLKETLKQTQEHQIMFRLKLIHLFLHTLEKLSITSYA